jgi:hypothetical protein
MSSCKNAPLNLANHAKLFKFLGLFFLYFAACSTDPTSVGIPANPSAQGSGNSPVPILNSASPVPVSSQAKPTDWKPPDLFRAELDQLRHGTLSDVRQMDPRSSNFQAQLDGQPVVLIVATQTFPRLWVNAIAYFRLSQLLELYAVRPAIARSFSLNQLLGAAHDFTTRQLLTYRVAPGPDGRVMAAVVHIAPFSQRRDLVNSQEAATWTTLVHSPGPPLPEQLPISESYVAIQVLDYLLGNPARTFVFEGSAGRIWMAEQEGRVPDFVDPKTSKMLLEKLEKFPRYPDNLGLKLKRLQPSTVEKLFAQGTYATWLLHSHSRKELVQRAKELETSIHSR